MDGILNILKPPGMTSFDVVAYLRRVLKTKKIGHTGTLDPDAVGVLPICVGKATKVIEYIVEKDKAYRAEVTFGVETDTQDSSGKIVRTCDVNLSEDDIKTAMLNFIGKIEQIPPMFSAIKIDGKKLYELARAGIEIERKPRNIEIYDIQIINISDDKNKVLFDVKCSKGTYIRTLCADIGQSLGCGGHMSLLVRTKAGKFDIDSSLTLEEVDKYISEQELDSKIITVDKVFDNLQRIILNEQEEKRLLNGVWIRVKNLGFEKDSFISVYNSNDVFIALGEIFYKEESLYLKTKKVF